MQNIRTIMEKKNTNPSGNASHHNLGLENLANIETSSISQINYTYNSNEDSLIKSKFTEEFEQSIINAALKEVKSNCSEETYETVRQYVQNNKIKEADNY